MICILWILMFFWSGCFVFVGVCWLVGFVEVELACLIACGVMVIGLLNAEIIDEMEQNKC